MKGNRGAFDTRKNTVTTSISATERLHTHRVEIFNVSPCFKLLRWCESGSLRHDLLHLTETAVWWSLCVPNASSLQVAHGTRTSGAAALAGCHSGDVHRTALYLQGCGDKGLVVEEGLAFPMSSRPHIPEPLGHRRRIFQAGCMNP
jgi:hypothetical protein